MASGCRVFQNKMVVKVCHISAVAKRFEINLCTDISLKNTDTPLITFNPNTLRSHDYFAIFF